MGNKLNIILFSSLLIYLLFTLFFLRDKSHKSNCQAVQIHIMDSVQFDFLRKNEVKTMIGAQMMTFLNEASTEINTLFLEKIIAKNPIVRKVDCYITPNHTLRIDILQREPIIRVMTGRQNYFLDKAGIEMPVTYNYLAYVPVATGLVNSDNKELLLEFAKFIHADDFWHAQIQQVHIHTNGKVELTPRVGNHRIHFGSLWNYKKKLQNLHTFYTKGLNYKGWNTYHEINLEYDNQVIGIK